MFSCCSSRKPGAGETRPLLQQQDEEGYDTTRERRVRQKLRTYEMVQALSRGFLPTTRQVVTHLRVLITSDFLNPANPTLSLAGRQLARDCRDCLRIFNDILLEKNSNDDLQGFLWQFSRTKASLDAADVADRASAATAQADTAADSLSDRSHYFFVLAALADIWGPSIAYDSIRTVGKLLMTNTDFRWLAKDLTTVGRTIYSDTAASLSTAAGDLSKEVAPPDKDRSNLGAEYPERAEGDGTGEPQQDAEQVSNATTEAVERAGRAAVQNTKEHLSGREKNALLSRMKQAVEGLRKREDYTTSISTLSELIQRYGDIYSHAIDSTVTAAEQDVDVNPELKHAIGNLWKFLGSFGDRTEWNLLEEKFHNLIQHSEGSRGFKSLVDDVSEAVHNLLTDPESIDSADATIEQLRAKSKESYPESARQDADAFLQQLNKTFQSVAADRSVARLATAIKKLANDFSTAYYKDHTTIPADALHIFLPHLVRAIQRIPIPRVEISEPEMDLLLENVILEPGHTFRNSSFLPFRVSVSTRSDMELNKTHSKEANTEMTNVVTVSMFGLNVSAKELGYWIRVHSAPFMPCFADEGIASFVLDERGIDISVDVEVGRERLEHILSLRAVRVHIHKLDYTIKKSSWSGLWWLLKPFLKHLVRRVLEKKIAEKIVSFSHILNRELVFARERLRAARIAHPDDFVTFLHAVLSRMSGRSDPDAYTRVGIAPSRKDVFRDVYAPGSLVKMWEEEKRRAEEAVDSGQRGTETWMNSVFDVVAPSSSRASTF